LVGAPRPRRGRGDRARHRRAAPRHAGDRPPRAAGGPALLRRLRRLRDPDRTAAGHTPRHQTQPGGPVNALVDPARLREELGRPGLVVLDIQFTLAGDGPDLYAVGHLPGAPFIDLDATLAGPPGEGGRHPLPSTDVLQTGLRA